MQRIMSIIEFDVSQPDMQRVSHGDIGGGQEYERASPVDRAFFQCDCLHMFPISAVTYSAQGL